MKQILFMIACLSFMLLAIVSPIDTNEIKTVDASEYKAQFSNGLGSFAIALDYHSITNYGLPYEMPVTLNGVHLYQGNEPSLIGLSYSVEGRGRAPPLTTQKSLSILPDLKSANYWQNLSQERL
jgi:hypothetical protein